MYKPREQLVIVFNYARMMPNYVWHAQRLLSEILECLIVPSVAKDCLVFVRDNMQRTFFDA